MTYVDPEEMLLRCKRYFVVRRWHITLYGICVNRFVLCTVVFVWSLMAKWPIVRNNLRTCVFPSSLFGLLSLISTVFDEGPSLLALYQSFYRWTYSIFTCLRREVCPYCPDTYVYSASSFITFLILELPWAMSNIWLCCKTFFACTFRQKSSVCNCVLNRYMNCLLAILCCSLVD